MRIVILSLIFILMIFSFAGCKTGSSKPVPTEGMTTDESGTPTASGTTITPLPSDAATPTPTTPDTGTKTVLYQLADPRGAQMMSYMVYTKEGKLFIIDGGYEWNSADIVKLAKEVTRKAVPTVDAWLFTHCHDDHVDAFANLMSSTPNSLEIKKIYYNFPSADYISTYASTTVPTYNKFIAAAKAFEGNKTVTVQKGDKFSIGSVSIEVLLTPDESITYDVINESSVVFRLTIEDQKVLILGDLGAKSGNRLKKEYGKDLVSDIVQMAHHGSNGINYPIYSTMKPKMCLWPTPKWLWENDYNGGGYNSGPWQTITIYEYLKNKGVEHHIVAKDGTQKLEFPVKF